MSNNYDIFRACAVGDIEYVKKSLREGINLNCRSEIGWTLLFYAIDNERKELVEFLIENGANVNYPSSNGCTPLHLAVDYSIDSTIQTGGQQGDEPLDMIKYLIDEGADVDAKDSKGKSPLDIAKIYNSKKVIEFLQGYK